MGKYVLAAVLVSSLLTLFLLPVRKGLRRFVGSIGVYALWLFVAISLLLPFPQMVYKAVAGRELFQQQSKFSVMNLVDLAQKNQKAVDNKSENEYNSVKKTSLSTGETAQNKLSQQGDIIDESSRTDPARLKEEEVQTWKDYVKTYGLYEIWLLGFLLLAVRQFVQERKFRKYLLEERSCVSVQSTIEKGSRRTCYGIPLEGSPFLFRSRGIKLDIYLPEQILPEDEVVDYAVLHESMHQRHGDIWWSYLRNFLVALYWFHPLVWLAARLSREDCELACDEAVAAQLSEKQKTAYGKSLLFVAALQHKTGFFSVATNMQGSKSQLEKRIRCICSKQRKSKCVTALVLILAIALCGCGMTTSVKTSHADTETVTLTESGTEMDTETVTQRQTVMDITLEVPKGLTLESYDAALGDYGGCLLKPDAYVGGYAPDEWKAAGYVMRFSTQNNEGSFGVLWQGDQISDVTIQWNHTEMKRLGNLSGLASSAYLIQTEHDLYTAAEWSELENTENAEPVSNYWCIMMARKGDAYGYAIALNAKNYTKQDTIAFAKTIQYDK